MRWATKKGTYQDCAYLPNITLGQGIIPNVEPRENGCLTRSQCIDPNGLGFREVIGPSFPARVHSRMFERAWHLFSDAYLHTSFIDSRGLTLWKAPSQGAYYHPGDNDHNNFYMFYAYSPIAFNMINDGRLQFNNQCEIPSGARIQ